MTKKLASIFSILIFLGIIIYRINNNFTYYGLLMKLENFKDFSSFYSGISIKDAPSIPVPDLSGFKQVIRGINTLIGSAYAIGETTLATIKLVPSLFRELFGLIKYCLGF